MHRPKYHQKVISYLPKSVDCESVLSFHLGFLVGDYLLEFRKIGY